MDKDTGVNGLVEYHIVKGEPQQEERLQVADGSDHFAINLPHQGQITVAKELDYEKVQRYLLTVVATVSGFILKAYFQSSADFKTC